MPVLTSIQLYSVREALESDLDGTLAELAARGFTNVEAFDFVRRADPLAAALRAHNLQSPTGHAMLATTSLPHPDGSGTVLTAPSPHAVFAAAKALDMTTVFDPFTAPDRWTSVEQIEATATMLNAAAEIGESFGIRVGYHNHAHELETSFDGRTGLEVLAGFLDPRVVLELDIYWVARAGIDAPMLVRSLGDRVVAVHVKDGTLDPEAIAASPPNDQVTAGHGVVPLAEALTAASALEYAIVEFDHYPGEDLFGALEQGRLFIEELSVR